jgi:capsular polysaccharide biosynthesis protein
LQPQDYWPVLRKRWPLILAVVVVAVVASYLFTRLQTPIYRAEANLTVKASRIGDYGQALAVEKNIRQYARELQKETLAEQVNDLLKLDLPVDGLRAKMRASPVMDDLTLQLEVDDTDPTRARDIAFAWAKEYVKVHQNQMASMDPRDRIEVDLLDRPAAAVLNWPKRNQIMATAAILGLLVGTLLAFLLEYVDDTLKSPRDVDRYVKAPLLAAIPALDAVPSANGHGRGRRLPPLVGRVPGTRSRVGLRR